MAELGGPLGRAQLKAKTGKAETPAKRLARVKAEARAEAFINRQSVPMDGRSFSGFLRTGSY